MRGDKGLVDVEMNPDLVCLHCHLFLYSFRLLLLFQMGELLHTH